MKWSLLELRKYQHEPLQFETTLDLKEELLSREECLMDISPIDVKGMLTVNKEDYLLHYVMVYNMTLPSSRSLVPVLVEQEITVDEVFMTQEMWEKNSIDEADESILLIEGQTISLDESVADNILLEIPLKVLSAEEQAATVFPSGNEWELISEEEYKEQQRQKEKTKDNSAFSQLADFFEDEES
ncbi:uncharacterized protein SAMN02745116_01616 [Pilibacter termitis]|uniref:ACR, COG1399 n=1 Tax=Pilibacter termitis TaxID=263852 RepID=A0A1T4P2I7_9ENTE|nr:YceD family protein [Pilibacter termitis]SJZ85622.1 uncharacterized protein SAMN02745116_01616 [Pilibacter termitis]